MSQAFEAGQLSEAQAKEVSKAAEVDPASQSELVRTAERKTLRQLKNKCGRIIAAADADETATYDRIHRARSLTWDTDTDGTWRLRGAFTPDAAAAIRSRLDAEYDHIFNEDRTDGRRERLDAYMADALVRLCEAHPDNGDGNGNANGNGNGSTPRREMVIHIDLAALRRGRTLSGETCEIAGIGGMPVEVARDLLDDAFIKAIIRDGLQIGTVAHFGRHCPAELRTALEFRDPTCATPGCDNPRVEIDHDQPHAEGGPHAIWNDNRLCRLHHHQKTHEGHQLVGEPGQRSWLDADGNVLSRDPPPDTDPDPP